jgi:hypothetical protein
MEGYLDIFLGATFWHCGVGHIGLLDKGLGVHLVCTNYPKSCQFISVSPAECPKYAQGSLVIEHHENKRCLCHSAIIARELCVPAVVGCGDATDKLQDGMMVTVYIPRSIHPLYVHGSFDCLLHEILESKRALSREMLIPLESERDISFIFSKFTQF